MNFKKIFWLILLLSIVISIGFVSASDVNDTTTYNIVAQHSENDLTDINEENNLETPQDNQISSQENYHIIYVGQNTSSDGGNGSYENPFNSFKLACNNLTGEEKVEINVYNGTYYLDSDFKFNTSNLFINGMGNVIIKNLRNSPGCYASFGLTSSTGNFTFNNIIFDGSNCSVSNEDRHFYVFMGGSNLGIFNNCSFINFRESPTMFSTLFNRKFNYCNFLGSYNSLGFIFPWDIIEMEFNYCTISSGLNLGNSGQYSIHSNITFNNVWMGQNVYSNYISYTPVDDNGLYLKKQFWPVNKQAIFSSWENYIGNNTFEILGKLTWDDGTTDGIEKLYPLTVKFSSKTGILPQNTILVNGEFKVIYKSESKENHIEVTLDSEDIFLDFKNDVQVSAKPIVYGEDQNITIILPQSSQGIAYVSLNNNTYEYEINGSSSFNFTVPDELLAETYQLTVKIVDNITHLYGQDTVEWIISQIDKVLFIQTPADANVDDENIIITVLLEDDETGNITVFVGDKNRTYECFGGNVDIDISDLLVGGNNNIIVYYSGNKKYTNQTKSDQISVNRINPKMNITKSTNLRIDEKISINITLPSGATGNITISSENKNMTITELNTLNIIDISKLLIGGLNTIYIKYSGDSWWDSQIKKETINVTKLTSSMDINIAPNPVKIGDNFSIIINMTQNTTGQLLIKINENNYKINITDDLTILNISSIISGVNKINITYTGDDKYYSLSKSVNITVLKLDIASNEMKISITNHTTPNITINVPNNVTGNVLVKINSQKHTISLINGAATLKVNDLTHGVYEAIITYLGDDNYNPFTVNLMFSVPKPVLKANDINMLYTSGLKYSVYVTASGNPVIGKTAVFTINGKKINTITDNKGYASLKIDLPPNSSKYTITAEYQGVKITNQVKVNSIIDTKNLRVKKTAKTLKIKVSLKKVNGKYLKGKKITLKFKGKKYTAKTNKKGVATFKINKKIIKTLKAGKKYAYKVNYLKDSATKKITVKK
ncbi:hypothetical protein [Methanobrevibacter sp.]